MSHPVSRYFWNWCPRFSVETKILGLSQPGGIEQKTDRGSNSLRIQQNECKNNRKRGKPKVLYLLFLKMRVMPERCCFIFTQYRLLLSLAPKSAGPSFGEKLQKDRAFSLNFICRSMGNIYWLLTYICVKIYIGKGFCNWRKRRYNCKGAKIVIMPTVWAVYLYEG